MYTFVILTVLVLSCSVAKTGCTALMSASGSGNTDMVRLLLSAGAQVDLQNSVRRNTLTTVGHSTL